MPESSQTDLVAESNVVPAVQPANKRLTAREVSELLGINLYTVYRWASTGRIPCVRMHGALRFKLSDIELWEKKQTVGKF